LPPAVNHVTTGDRAPNARCPEIMLVEQIHASTIWRNPLLLASVSRILFLTKSKRRCLTVAVLGAPPSRWRVAVNKLCCETRRRDASAPRLVQPVNLRLFSRNPAQKGTFLSSYHGDILMEFRQIHFRCLTLPPDFQILRRPRHNQSGLITI
jgi:hypothetical protein